MEATPSGTSRPETARKLLRRGSFASEADLIAKDSAFIKYYVLVVEHLDGEESAHTQLLFDFH